MQPSSIKARSHRSRGFTLVETMVSMAVMLFIALAILPLFTRSMAAATSGREKTDVATFLRVADDQLVLPLGLGETVPPGGASSRETAFSWCQGDSQLVADPAEGWFADPSAKGQVLWDRRTKLRQFSVRALDADLEGYSDLADSEAIAGGATPELVHLTITDVLLDGRRKAGPLGPGVLMSARQIRAF